MLSWSYNDVKFPNSTTYILYKSVDTISGASERTTITMACEGCRSQARSVIRVAVRTSRAPALTAATTTKRCLSSLGNNVSQKNSQQVRYFSRTSQRNMLEGIGGGSSKPYFVVAATESLYKICGEAANYRITEEDRKKDLVTKLDDGEEIGNSTSKVDVWHKSMYPRQYLTPKTIFANTP